MHKSWEFCESTRVDSAWNMRFKLHHELVISFSIKKERWKQRAARAENHINFISSCRIVITILSIFMLFMATWIAFLWSIQSSWHEVRAAILNAFSYIQMFFASCFLAHRYTTTGKMNFHVRRNLFLSKRATGRDEGGMRFTAKFMFCERFYAGKNFITICNEIGGRKKISCCSSE